MEDQDQLIVTSLHRMGFQLPGTVAQISDIDGDILQSICLQFLKKLGFNPKPSNSTQKFRIATQIQEDMKKEGGLRLEISVLMSPNVQDLRKTLISIVSRLSLADNNVEDQQQKLETHQEKVTRTKKDIKEGIINQWQQEEWIHPFLLNDEAHIKPFRIYDTNIDLHSKSIQKVLVTNNFDKQTKPNLFSSLARIIDSAKQRNIEQEKQNNKFYTQDNNQKNFNQQKHKVQFKDMVNKNAKEWQNLKKNKVIKLAKKMKGNKENQQNEQIQQEQAPVEEQKQTLFELEQQFQSEQNTQEDQGEKNPDFDLESLKQQHEQEIDEVQQKIDQLQQKINKFDQKRAVMEENIIEKTEQIENYKEANIQLEQNVSQLHQLLEQLKQRGGGEDLAKEVQQLENDIQDMEREWGNIKKQMESNIQEQRQHVLEKREKMDQLREKSKRLENEYVNIVGDIRNAYDTKQALHAECQKLPKEIYGRQKYVRSITEIGKNFNKQKDEIKKIVSEVEEQDQLISGFSTTLQRYYIEFENSFNTDTKKKESLHVQIYKLYEEYRSIFEKTISTLKDSATKKIEIREAEARIEVISSKGYTHSVDKLKRDLEDIKLENQQFQQQLDYYKQQEQLLQQQQQQQNQQYQQQNQY